jgi:DNA-damage-inducible protein J
LPFEIKAPNATTRKAIKELEAGKGKKFSSVEALMADLNADD